MGETKSQLTIYTNYSKPRNTYSHIFSKVGSPEPPTASAPSRRRPLLVSDSWKLIYSSAGCGGRNGKGADHLKSIEEISYVSENFRISHTDSGVLRVCKRVSTSVRSTGGASAEDDTGANVAAMMMSDAGGEGKKAGRASATAAGRAPRRTAPLRKRMFLGWLRRWEGRSHVRCKNT